MEEHSRLGLRKLDAAELACLIGILLLSLGLRLGWVLSVDPERFLPNVIDSIWYYMQAVNIQKGAGFINVEGNPTAYFAPGYPAMLAATFSLFGNDVLVAKLLNVVLGTLTSYFVFSLGRKLYGIKTGLIAAAIFSVFPGTIAYSSLLLSEIAFQCLFTGTLLAFLPSPGVSGTEDRPSLLRCFGFGLLLGASALVRGIALPFFAVPIGLLWWQHADRRAAARKIAALLLGGTLLIGGWMTRNYFEMNGAIFLTSDGALALIHGHSPIANGGHVIGMTKWRLKQFPEASGLRGVEREVAMSKVQLRYAVSWALTHPLEELVLTPKRFYHFFRGDQWAFDPYKIALTQGAGAEERLAANARQRWLSALGLAASIYFFVVLGLAIATGSQTSWRSPSPQLLLPLTILYFTFCHSLLFFGSPRFHAPIVPALCVLAAAVRLARGARSEG